MASNAQIVDKSFTTLRVNKLISAGGARSGFIPTGAIESLSASDDVNLTSYATHVNTTVDMTVQLPVATLDGQLKVVRNVGVSSLVVSSSDISGGSQVTVASDAQVTHATFMWTGKEWLLIDGVGQTLA